MQKFSSPQALALVSILAAGCLLNACSKEPVQNPATGGAPSGGTGTTGGSGTGGTDAGGSGSGATGSGGVPVQAGPPLSEPISPFIVVDQFGYLADSEKVAVLRDPEVGFDATESYVPGPSYQIVDVATGTVVQELAAAPWSGGMVHAQSGDKAYWVDFSALTAPGEYYVRDAANWVRSDAFRIGPDVYREVFRHAFRTFFYQRASFAKEAPFAEAGWTDAASHLGAGQDTAARLYEQTDDIATERDLSGGWFDAGDYNRYTAWSADYVLTLLRMYEERPEVFGDDFGLPESGNGVPDVLDEARVGLLQLIKTQSETGGCVSVLGTDPQYETASPPSALTAAAVYGPETTNATLRAGIAFAWGARLYVDSDPTFAADLLARAELAWTFAETNPNLVFENTGKIAAGEQQSSPEDVLLYQLGLAVSLHRVAAGGPYKAFFEANYEQESLSLLSGYNAGWQVHFNEFYLDYAALADADPAIEEVILSAYLDTVASANNLGMLTSNPDPYLAFVDTYTWGSNAHKARTGCMFHDVITFGLDAALDADARRAAERFIHYLHGVNPLSLVYLTNMGGAGAHKSASTVYHAWFADGSAAWDQVGVSTYGPPPGFLTGGPNPTYALDAVCPGDPGCPAMPPAPPSGQPDQKSYLDFNDNWPVNSWSVSENSNGYQVYYLRLLSKFVN